MTKNEINKFLRKICDSKSKEEKINLANDFLEATKDYEDFFIKGFEEDRKYLKDNKINLQEVLGLKFK
jgi:hypothetical protein